MSELHGIIGRIRNNTEDRPLNQIETITHLLAESIIVREKLRLCSSMANYSDSELIREIASLEKCVKEKGANDGLSHEMRKIFHVYHRCLQSIRTSNVSLIIKMCVNKYIDSVTKTSFFFEITDNLRGEIGANVIGHLENRKKKMDINDVPKWVLITAVSSGMVFLISMFIVALFIPEPTNFQFFIFRTILALAGAGFGLTLPGFIKVELPLWKKGLISAGGALAIFVLIYLVNPALLLKN